MKINRILKRFLQALFITGSAIFTAKPAVAEPTGPADSKTINDRINRVREELRKNATDNGDHGFMPGDMKNPPLNQIWINIVPNWHDWNKLWNDWANWNNWSKWNDWANYHRDNGKHKGHYDNDRGHDNGRGHGNGHGNGHGKGHKD